MRRMLLALAVMFALPAAAHAQTEAEFAKQLANPVSSLISVPFQSNYDCCYGPEDAARYTLNIQPVIPISMNDSWNVIIRTIVPVIYQDETTAGGDDQGGFGNSTQSFFFSPKHTESGIIWGVGPAFLWPIGSDGLSTGKYGAGPTFVVLKQSEGVTFGMLANQIWSYAGKSDRPDLSQLFLQPFFAYTWPSSLAFNINTETTYDWNTEQWTVPINAGFSHVYKFGEQRVQLALQGRVYAERPSGGPDWGARFNVTFLFPTG